ncbi:MAG: hypothetical protein FD144_4232 [Rhodospirillaceae bacterium]|nr:MAG: hypothetical protein FD144_4232 [Rhodospirillaceae bacterium]
MNQHKQCVVSDCHAYRTRFGRFCHRHRRRLAQYGHPTARPLSRSGEDLAGWSRKIEALLAANAGHPGLSRASRELQRELDDAAQRARNGDTLSGVSAQLARLAAHGVTPEMILARAVAVVVIERSNPRLFPDQRSLEFAIARAVFGLAPNTGTPGARVLASTGKRLVEQYVELIVAAVVALQTAEDDARKREADMRAPLRIPSTNP